MSNQLEQAGRYKAVVVDFGLGESKNKIPEFSAEYEITHVFQGGEWHDWQEYHLTIRGYHYPFKKDGSTNEKTIEQLMGALGWDGTSLSSLADGAFAGKEVQIQVKDEKDEKGNPKLKVAWLDPADATPGIRKLDESGVKSMANTWDSKLRAMNGAAKSAAKPNGGTRPTPPKKTPAATA